MPEDFDQGRHQLTGVPRRKRAGRWVGGRTGPSGLMTGTHIGAVIAVEHVTPPVRIVLELLGSAPWVITAVRQAETELASWAREPTKIWLKIRSGGPGLNSITASGQIAVCVQPFGSSPERREPNNFSAHSVGCQEGLP